jgi:HK97 gp10 family phage protein
MADDLVWMKMEGLSELQDLLERMKKEASDRIVKDGLNAGAKLVLDAEVDNAPELTGFLKENFNIRFSSLKEGVGGEAYIGPNGKINYPQRGEQRDANGKVTKRGRTIAVASVARFHEFGTSKMGADAFMRTAWYSVREAVLQTIIDTIHKELFTSKYHT